MAPMMRVRSRRVVARRGADQRDRERAGDGVDEERDLPPPVPAGEEEVALDEGVRRLQLVRQQGQGSVLSEGAPGSGRSPARTGISRSRPGSRDAHRPRRRPSRMSDSAHLATGSSAPARGLRGRPSRNDRSSAWRSLIVREPELDVANMLMILSRGEVMAAGLVAVLGRSSRHLLSWCRRCQSSSSSSSTSSSRERPVKVMNTDSSVGGCPWLLGDESLEPLGRVLGDDRDPRRGS